MALPQTLTVLTWAAAALVAGAVLLILYRLLLHPLAGVPGPKLAAASAAYEFYYDCILGGKYHFKIEELHRQYGPVVRINPWEVHINDPPYWDVLYSNSSKLDKDKWFYGGFVSTDPGATVATPSHDLHRIRRGAMSSYFSSANVRKLEPVVLSRVQKLCDRLEEHRTNGHPVNLSNAFRCLATDVVTYFAFPKPRSMLDTPDFSKDFTRLLRDFSSLITWQRHLKIVFPILMSIPDAVTVWMDASGGSKQMVEYQRSFIDQSSMAVRRKGKPEDGSSPSILDAIASSPQLGEKDKTPQRIAEEAQLTVGAGSETTGATLATFVYYVSSHRSVSDRLKAELKQAATQSSENQILDHKTLEKLPYLQACITESLRIASPVSGRLPRVNPRADMSFTDPKTGKTYVFPKRTVMSMSMQDLHYDADIFPSPSSFEPERWLNADPEKLARMQQAYVPFSRGSRNCIGQELAKQELTLTAGNLMLLFDFELYQTSERDIKLAHDWFAPYAELDSEGVRVKVR
ncbi:hypothetical protein LTR56_012638 [Elasticomyces elasticus]|nr:hypothetical protein LTR56_012638 [Elasticomyces elasticus]KAK3668306.1 hypothetical protein LTR22_000991 [Elasticomyces elasticus]KAK4922797.1 hypothetical protein LTR49_009985 [Elasticomyces elasticus]KAK5769370.1 hypothetical protein LTS12_000297 [Elasticomyces elasticus]